MDTKDNLILVGIISSVHGIQGCVTIKSFTSPITNILTMDLVNALNEKVTLKFVRENSKSHLICRINDISNRNAAEMLKGSKLFCHPTSLPKLGQEEFYVKELQGLLVVNESLQPLGQINGIFNFGAGDIIEVKFPSSAKTELFPFNKQFFPIIAEHYVVLTIPKQS